MGYRSHPPHIDASWIAYSLVLCLQTLLITSQGEFQIFTQSRISLFAFAFRVPCLVCKCQGKGAAGQQRIRLSIKLQGVTWPAQSFHLSATLCLDARVPCRLCLLGINPIASLSDVFGVALSRPHFGNVVSSLCS